MNQHCQSQQTDIENKKQYDIAIFKVITFAGPLRQSWCMSKLVQNRLYMKDSVYI